MVVRSSDPLSRGDVSIRGLLKGVVVAAALAVGAGVCAHEPDGHVVIRYDWVEPPAGETAPPKLRIVLTAVVDVRGLKLDARLPAGVGIAVRGAQRMPLPWPADGLQVGDLDAGRSVVLDLDVEKPASGGGIVGFALTGQAGGMALHEGVGVSVGAPPVEPTLRNGALEFPAASGDPNP